MDPPNMKSSCATQNKNTNPMGLGLAIDYVTGRNIQNRTLPLPHIESSCATQNRNSMRSGIDYVAWRNIHKCIPPTSNLHVGHKIKIPILWVYGQELTMSHGGLSNNGSPHIKSSCGTQNKNSNPMGIGLGIPLPVPTPPTLALPWGFVPLGGGGGAAKPPPSNRGPAHTLALWWLKFGPTARVREW